MHILHHPSVVLSWFITRTGEFAVSVSSDKKMQFYAGKTGEPSFDIPDAHAGSIYSVAVNPTSTQLVTASADKSVKLWEVAEGSATCVQTCVPCEGPAQVRMRMPLVGVILLKIRLFLPVTYAANYILSLGG